MKKTKMHRLSAEERPLFGGYNSVHATAKDKANKRQNRKLETKKARADYENNRY